MDQGVAEGPLPDVPAAIEGDCERVAMLGQVVGAKRLGQRQRAHLFDGPEVHQIPHEPGGTPRRRDSARDQDPLESLGVPSL